MTDKTVKITIFHWPKLEFSIKLFYNFYSCPDCNVLLPFLNAGYVIQGTKLCVGQTKWAV